MSSAGENHDHYLRQEVLSASPLRLRWMLIQRAEALCGLVGQLWSEGDTAQADGWLLRIREILGELLAGVQDQSNPASGAVCDFYIFLLQLVGELESTRSAERLKVLEELLHIENQTWEQVVAKSLLEASSRGHQPAPLSVPLPISQPAPQLGGTPMDCAGGFSLEV